MDDSRVIHIPAPKPLPGYACPRCGGMGTNMDGGFGINADGSATVTRATDCGLCLGSGRVNITPIKKEDLG